MDNRTGEDLTKGYSVAAFPSQSKVIDASKMNSAGLQKEIGKWDGICYRRRGELLDRLARAEQLAVDTKARWEEGHKAVVASIDQVRSDLARSHVHHRSDDTE